MADTETAAEPVKPKPRKPRKLRKQTVKIGPRDCLGLPDPKVPHVDLSDLIPAANFKDRYVGRKLPGGKTDLEMLAAAHDSEYNVLLQGPTGSAKTSLALAYAAAVEMPLVQIQCNGGSDPFQLLGGWTPQPDGTFEFAPGPLTLGLSQGAVILLNEVNFLPPSILPTIFGILDFRKYVNLPMATGSAVWPAQFTMHPDTFLIADCNPAYFGVKPLSPAFRNRFAVKQYWDYDGKVEKKLVPSATLVKLAAGLRGGYDGVPKIAEVLSTNMLIEFTDMALNDAIGGWEFAKANFLGHFEGEELEVVSRDFELNEIAIQEDLGLI